MIHLTQLCLQFLAKQKRAYFYRRPNTLRLSSPLGGRAMGKGKPAWNARPRVRELEEILWNLAGRTSVLRSSKSSSVEQLRHWSWCGPRGGSKGSAGLESIFRTLSTLPFVHLWVFVHLTPPRDAPSTTAVAPRALRSVNCQGRGFQQRYRLDFRLNNRLKSCIGEDAHYERSRPQALFSYTFPQIWLNWWKLSFVTMPCPLCWRTTDLGLNGKDASSHELLQDAGGQQQPLVSISACGLHPQTNVKNSLEARVVMTDQ